MGDRSPSRIPAPVGNLRRSSSVRVRGERPLIVYSTSPIQFPSIAEREELTDGVGTWSSARLNSRQRSRSQASGLNKKDDDLESVESMGSNVSGLSRLSTRSNCDHSPFAKNGTTYSGRSHKYVLHCSAQCNAPDEYLTPTQRANQNIRRLKTLLQLAKDKLIEKEREIFKLTKEVVELKVFKASMQNCDFSPGSSPSDCKDSPRAIDCCEAATFTLDDARELGTDTFADLTPIQPSRSFAEKLDNDIERESPRRESTPISPLHGFQRDKMSATPDYLLSSLTDSGHFDDLASSLSLQSKDSLHSNLHLPEEKRSPGNRDREEERARLVKIYEALLSDRREAHERELRSVKCAHEESNLKMLDSFESKLKEEESKFEEKFQALLKSTELEKIKIVEEFEKKLDEAKAPRLPNGDANGRVPAVNISETYFQTVEMEKEAYEQALANIKQKFDDERLKIEKSFDDAMAVERSKFEETVTDIQLNSERQIQSLNEKAAEYERKYNELLEKYHDSLHKISELEKSNQHLRASLEEQEAKQRELYLKMYMKGQEAVKFQCNDEVAQGTSYANVPAPELLVQLKVTEVELENLKDSEYRAQHKDELGGCLLSAKEALSLWMLAARKAMYKRLAEAQKPVRPSSASHESQNAEATLQFLKSAVYYFLTDRDNHLDHLRAIERILGFTQSERRDIAQHYTY